MKQLTVIVGSENPVKVNAAKDAFSILFPDNQIECKGVGAPSNVADQPMSADETRIGACNRVRYCEEHWQADYYVAMEGGVDCFEYGPATFAYVVISDKQRESVGRSANLPIPQKIFDALHQGRELGGLMDEVFGTNNVKQKGGAIGLLTNGAQTRTSAYTQALTMAMGPFLHRQLFEA